MEFQNVYKTRDPSIFKTLQGNRSVSDGRVQKILKSIEKIGYVGAPILVNEKLEVIDGQGRLEAVRRLTRGGASIEIPYTVVHGIGIEECRLMNSSMTNWTSGDYIRSIAESGNPDYKRWHSFIERVPALALMSPSPSPSGRLTRGGPGTFDRVGSSSLPTKRKRRRHWQHTSIASTT